MYYTYTTLNRQCQPQTPASASNQKFLTTGLNDARLYGYPKHPPLFKKEDAKSSCALGGEKTCSTLDNDPSIWGPNLWKYLHYSAANYPEHPTPQQVEDMKNWLCTLPVTIPCPTCSKHYKGYIEQNKPKLTDICSDKDKLFDFLVDIHNKVNERNGKRVISYEEARSMY